jgi:hypothetical protein
MDWEEHLPLVTALAVFVLVGGFALLVAPTIERIDKFKKSRRARAL